MSARLTIEDLRDAVERASVRVTTDAGRSAVSLAREWLDAAPTTAGGTMRSWFDAVPHGARVHTLQVGYGGRLWASLFREVTARRATFVEIGGSRRDYAGMAVLAADATTLVVASAQEVILYRVAEGGGVMSAQAMRVTRGDVLRLVVPSTVTAAGSFARTTTEHVEHVLVTSASRDGLHPRAVRPWYSDHLGAERRAENYAPGRAATSASVAGHVDLRSEALDADVRAIVEV